MKAEPIDDSYILMQEAQPGKKPYTIFVVEDSDIYRMVLERSLNRMPNADLSNKPNCAIYSFSSAEGCLEQLEKKTLPDIVVLDYFLNEENANAMNGLELLKEIKKRSPKTEVLILSAQKDVLITAELFNQGAAGYIPKEPQGQNRVQNAVLHSIGKIEKQRISNRNKNITIIVLLILGMAVAVILLSTVS